MIPIITIGRQYGSGGREIGHRLAEALGIKCYDREIIQLTANQSGMSADVIKEKEEQPYGGFLYSYVSGLGITNFGDGLDNLPLSDKIFLAQSNVIKNLADSEPCVIVGRCADYVLREIPNVLRVFIYGDIEDRLKRATEVYKLEAKKPLDVVNRIDKRRSSYYSYYSGKKWGAKEGYDISINSSFWGIEGTVKLLSEVSNLDRVNRK